MATHSFPERRRELVKELGQLRGLAPDTMKAFGALHGAAVADGELDTMTKELIALAVGVATQCDGCIAFHVHDAIKAGATDTQIAEAVGVAVLMGGGPAAMYGADALAAAGQFRAEQAARQA